jgi:hypothetical protein
MANFITTSVSWAGKETFDYLIKPMFVGKSPLETEGIRVMPNVQDKQLLNYFNPVAKMLKAAAVGFSGSTGATYTQRTLEVYKLKAEQETDATVFYNTVFGQLLAKGNWNDLSVSDKAAMLQKVLTEMFMMGLASDVYRQAWLADTVKEGVTSSVQNGVADTAYNMYDGFWKLIMNNAATSPSATQIKRIAVTDGAVAQVQTLTQSVDAAGTANINIDGVNYLATRDTNATTTFDNFRTAYSTALAARGYALSGTSTLIVTATVVGRPMQTITVTSVSGTWMATVAATTANTAPSALSAGEAHTILTSLWTGAPKELKQIPKNMKAFYVGDLVYENLIAYLESTGWTTAGYQNIVNGTQEILTFRGIPVINIGWDYHLDADFAHVSTELWAYPHRVIYSAYDNLILGIDGANEFNSYDFWFNKDLEMNRWRAKLIMGVQYAHNKLLCVAY